MQAELNVFYSTEVRNNLSYFPVWEPGAKISAGDVGPVVKGVFEKKTTIQDLLGFTPTVVREQLPHPTRF
jgi:hypothetical protein